jgi:murein DD-endopeptidase MepM/ murein hydrolase activator NlpD
VDVADPIGTVGSTGNTTGPHLHLEVRPDGGDPVDPVDWLRAAGLTP